MAEKIEHVLDLIEQNAGLLAGLARRVGGEAAKQAPAVAGAVAEAVGDAAKQAPVSPLLSEAGDAASALRAAGVRVEAAGEAAGDAASALGEAAGKAIELIGEELVQPVTRYGRGTQARPPRAVGARSRCWSHHGLGRLVWREKLKAAGSGGAGSR